MGKGFQAAQDGHIVNILSPQSISGGASSQAFCMKNHAHATIVVGIGAQAAAASDVTLKAGADATMATSQAIAFDVYKQEVAGNSNDVLGTRVPVDAKGFAPSANANIFYVLEVDADTLPANYDWLQLEVANGANVDYWSAVAILSGARFASDQSDTVTA